MARYIDGTALLNKYNSRNMTANEMYQALVEQPTADVVEVKHGEWKKKIDDFDWEYIKCSICGEELYPPDNDDTFDVLPKYCQECGAKMDGKEKNDVEN